jgi:alkaline phosphatase D
VSRDQPSLPRRQFLQGAAALLTLPAIAEAATDEPSWLWSGAVTHESASVVVGFARPPAATPALLVSPSRDLGGAVRVEGAATLAPSRRRAERTVVVYRLEGLSPAVEYFAGFDPLSGTRVRFRTFGRGPFSFTAAFASCAGGTRPVPASHVSNSRVFDAIAALDPHVFIHMGDFHYYNIIGPASPPDLLLGRFRRALDRVLSQEHQALFYRRTPLVYMWDDHDYGPNDADSRSPTRTAARTYYAQDVPHYPLPLCPAADGPICQAFDIGRVRFLVTDARSERLEPAGTLLGTRQKAWLLEEFERAVADRAPLVVWVNPVPWITTDGDVHGWGRFAAERREIGERITALGLGSRLVMLSGDAHMLAFDDGRNNLHGGFPVAQAAPLDRYVRRKGGPYSHEPPKQENHQFATLQVDDTGTVLTVTLQGYRFTGSTTPTPVSQTRLRIECAGLRCDAPT